MGVDRDVGAARERRQLQLGQLEDDAVVGGQLRQQLDERRADVAAQDDRVAVRRARTAAISELVVVLPLVPVTPTVRAGQSRRKRSTSLMTGTRPAASTGGQRGAQARLGRRDSGC